VSPTIQAPVIDYLGLSPVLAPLVGSILVLMLGLARGPLVQRWIVPGVAKLSLIAAIVLAILAWPRGEAQPIISGALTMDALTLSLSILVFVSAIFCIAFSWRSENVRLQGAGEYHSLLLASVTGMVVLLGSTNLVTLFIGFELLSIPLYVMCGSAVKTERSLESGMKYLIVGSVGSATMLYGLALIYGATGTTDFSGIAQAIGDVVPVTDPLLLTGLALSLTGFAFKASIAPFHQWTPDVYQGAPTPVTGFMAVATKAAALGLLIRFLLEPLGAAELLWGPALAVLAWITIIVGNVGALGQTSVKRLLGWSGVAQAGYLLAGLVVGSQFGLAATIFYLIVYVLMNLAAFAVVIARERVHEAGDHLQALEGLGRSSPWLAWPMTIAMLGLAGFPLTAGFFGKFFLIGAAVTGGYESLAVAIVIGSMISLGYYLRIIAVMWMKPGDLEIPSADGRPARRIRPIAGWSPEADAKAQPEIVGAAVLASLLVVAIGVYPGPLMNCAQYLAGALGWF
jgi:NADH-quinone oxidoreductase subunit N